MRMHSGVRRFPARHAGVSVSLLGMAAAVAGCPITDATIEGPVPAPQEVRRVDTGFPEEPVLCSDLPSRIAVSGEGFSPLPVDTLTSNQGVALPEVSLTGAGATVALGGVTFDPDSGDLAADVAAGLAEGIYDLEVRNPNENTGVLANAVQVVPPPTLDGMTPDSGNNTQDTDVVIAGGGFRVSGDEPPVQPRARLDAADGGAGAELSNVTLREDGTLTATVPSGLAPGLYDLTVINPEGCATVLGGAFEVYEAETIELCDFVDPAFGWVDARTTIEICAVGAGGEGTPLVSTPEAFLLIDGDAIRLRREAFLDPGSATEPSLMSAVVPSRTDDARIVVGGPYDIRVVNPDGTAGTIREAFTILPDPPPQITAINPGRGDQNATITLSVIGHDFKDGTLDDGAPILTVALLAEDGTEHACGDTTVTFDAGTAEHTATCSITLPGTTGGYVVRVRHEDDGSFDLFSMFAVTEPARKLDQTTAEQEPLDQARRAHGVALGRNDLGQRFLYVAGGEGPDGSALSSVERAAISRFGHLRSWQTVSTELPQGRTGVALVTAGHHLYLVGGSEDGQAPVTEGTVLRARILGGAEIPELLPPEPGTGGSLEAGTYYYRVSAVMGAGTDNPGGETLASDHETARVSASGRVVLSWTVEDTDAVAHYRIYRTPDPDMTRDEMVLVADEVVGETFEDAGETALDPEERPLPAGSLGVWVPVAELDVPRFDAAAAVVRVDTERVFIYVAGGRDGTADDDVLTSVEWAPLLPDGADLDGDWQTGPDLPTRRADHVLLPVSHRLAESLPTDAFGVVAAAGSRCARNTVCLGGAGIAAIHSTPLDLDPVDPDDTGQPVAWGDGGTLSGTRVGGTGIVVNDHLYAFNGWSGQGGAFANASEHSAGTQCVDGPPCTPRFTGFSAATMSFSDGVRYRSGMAFFGAFFYFVGGSQGLDVSSTSATVLRGSY
jgi:hypothetical protein